MRAIDPIDRIALMEKLGIEKECTVCEQNPDWVESVTTQYIGYAKESTYAVEAKEDSECERS